MQRSSQTRRIIAPDLARGLALFSIGWANLSTAWALADGALPGSYFGGIIDNSLLDQISVVGSAMFAHVRGLPMFTTLLGFGLGLIAVSLARRQYPARNARRVLAGRYGWLALFGAVHLVLLFFGDIIYFYGLMGMILALMIRLRDKLLLWIAGILYAVGVVGASALALTAADTTAASADMSDFLDFGSYAETLVFNFSMLVGQTLSFPFALFTLLPLAILGFVAARQGVHLNVARYARQLWVWVWIAAAVVVLVGLPWGLSAIGVLPTAWESVFSEVNGIAGYLTGPGIAAAILLASRGLQKRADNVAAGESFRLALPLEMVAALGKRSMSGYLLMSVLFFIIAMPFTLDLARDAGAFGQLLIALGVWLVLVIAMWVLEKAGVNGPFEWLHRRLSYGRRGLMDPWQDPALAGTYSR